MVPQMIGIKSQAPVLVRRLRTGADINQPTIPADTVENDPMRTSGTPSSGRAFAVTMLVPAVT